MRVCACDFVAFFQIILLTRGAFTRVGIGGREELSADSRCIYPCRHR